MDSMFYFQAHIVVASYCLVALTLSVNGAAVPGSGSSSFVRSSFGPGSDAFGLGSGSIGSGFTGFGRVGGSGQGAGRDTVVVTQTRTIDEIVTRVSTVFNTQQVTLTDFVLQTVTSQTYQVSKSKILVQIWKNYFKIDAKDLSVSLIIFR